MFVLRLLFTATFAGVTRNLWEVGGSERLGRMRRFLRPLASLRVISYIPYDVSHVIGMADTSKPFNSHHKLYQKAIRLCWTGTFLILVDAEGS